MWNPTYQDLPVWAQVFVWVVGLVLLSIVIKLLASLKTVVECLGHSCLFVCRGCRGLCRCLCPEESV